MSLYLILYLNILIIGLLIIMLFNFQRMSKRVSGSESGADMLVDTSSLIDGRIVEVIKAGFIDNKFLIPEFILKELQQVADSKDPIRRAKGREGLKNLRNIQKLPNIDSEVIEEDFPEIKYIDERLIKLAKLRKTGIVTVDFNLNNVAQIQKIRVLNINELANSLRPLFVPGEELDIKIVQRGKEGSQGVGYMDDGTMVVVEDGMKFLHKTVKCMVSRILQTDAGRMVFARPKQYGMDRIGGDRMRAVQKPFSKFLPWQMRKKPNYTNRYNNGNHSNNNNHNTNNYPNNNQNTKN
ncbi:PIN/TRAM domain-containing protein [Patescibacteria group bacterium]